MMRTLEEVADVQVELMQKLKVQIELEPEIFNDQYNLQKHLRHLYDQKKVGQLAFAKKFGSVSEKIMSFDLRFQADEVWKIYLLHFGEPS